MICGRVSTRGGTGTTGFAASASFRARSLWYFRCCFSVIVNLLRGGGSRRSGLSGGADVDRVGNMSSDSRLPSDSAVVYTGAFRLRRCAMSMCSSSTLGAEPDDTERVFRLCCRAMSMFSSGKSDFEESVDDMRPTLV